VAKNKVELTLIAKDKATSVLSKFKVGLVAATAAIAAIAFAAKKMIDAFTENEVVMAKLRAGLKNVGDASAETEKSIVAQAEALSLLTGISDEEIINTQALLTTFALTGDQIEELTPLILDMSSSLLRAGDSSIDLQGATLAVGKAMTDGIGMLSRYGVVIDDAEKAAFKNMNTQQKLATITKALSENFAGQSAAIGGTFQGRLGALSSLIGDLAEEFGGFLVSGLKPVVLWLIKLAQSAKEVIKEFKEANTATGKLTQAEEKLAEMEEKLSRAGGKNARNLRIRIKLQEKKVDRLRNLTFATFRLGEAEEALGKLQEDLEGKNARAAGLINLRIRRQKDIIAGLQAQVEAEKIAADASLENLDKVVSAEAQAALNEVTLTDEKNKLLITMEQAAIALRVQIADAGDKERLKLIKKLAKLEVDINKKKEDDKTKDEDAARQKRQVGIARFDNFMLQNASAAGKTGAAISKAIQIKQTLINTKAAAIGAYNALVGIPIVGPVLAVAAAGAATAFGLAKVNEIRSLEHGGIIPGSESGTLIRAGEASKSEAIIPLEDAEGGIGGDTFIFVNGTVDAEFMDMVEEELSERARLGKSRFTDRLETL